ncbi:hypothetical protein CC86DRAFT_426244 [Ophiobolus disseminans]|uniref:RING-type domain-containing protein n=1 Tax=Ophiobolus disseminans TaxID=1469910 RepID=A0A6A6ZM61_9PLEO|nr:hypothetical protein CC86DRAFT_426244 [Ophiobolus disseminans]
MESGGSMLPKLDEYRSRLTNRKVHLDEVEGEICAICQKGFEAVVEPVQEQPDDAAHNNTPPNKLKVLKKVQQTANVRVTRSKRKETEEQAALTRQKSRKLKKRASRMIEKKGNVCPTSVEEVERNRRARSTADWRDNPEVDSDILSISPCAHLFHVDCISTWLNGVTQDRNLCPTCKTPLCRLSVLEPFHEAQCVAETWDIPKTAKNIEALIKLLTATDEMFGVEYQKTGDNPDYAHISRAVRDKGQGTCPNIKLLIRHTSGGIHWIDVIAAQRVHERLVDTNVLETWSGQQFLGLYSKMMDMYGQLYGKPTLLDPAQEHGKENTLQHASSNPDFTSPRAHFEYSQTAILDRIDPSSSWSAFRANSPTPEANYPKPHEGGNSPAIANNAEIPDLHDGNSSATLVNSTVSNTPAVSFGARLRALARQPFHQRAPAPARSTDTVWPEAPAREQHTRRAGFAEYFEVANDDTSDFEDANNDMFDFQASDGSTTVPNTPLHNQDEGLIGVASNFVEYQHVSGRSAFAAMPPSVSKLPALTWNNFSFESRGVMSPGGDVDGTDVELRGEDMDEEME